MSIRLVVADNQPLMLDGVASLFSAEDDFDLLARCKDGMETMQAIRRYQPDVAILDICLAGIDGMTIVRKIRTEELATRIVIFTAEIDENQMLEALCSGVRGIILKEMASQLLVQCVRAVHRGDQWIERNLASLNLEKVLHREARMREIAALITPREMAS
jgi:DNA-binding NarL/FixJ family response regulator